MKKNQHFWLAVLFCCSQSLQAQFTVTFKPNATQGQDAQLRYNDACTAWQATNYGAPVEINPTAWTYYGPGCGAGVYRSLLRFDGLSSLPAGATVQYAELRLYGVASSGNTNGNSSYPGAPFGTTNELWVRQVTSAWNESTVTWNTQPSFTTAGQLAVPASVSQWNHNVALNVTNLVSAMLAPGANNGFIIMLQNENYYRSMIFASSDHPDAARWPELYVQYTTSGCTANFLANTTDRQTFNFTGSADPQLQVANVFWSFGDGGTSVQWPYTSNTYYTLGVYNVCLQINYTNGCSASKCLNVRVRPSIISPNRSQIGKQPTDIAKVTPNPAAGGTAYAQLNNSQPGIGQYRVFNANGKVMQTGIIALQQGAQTIPVNITALTPGNYWVEIVNGSLPPTRTAFIKL